MTPRALLQPVHAALPVVICLTGLFVQPAARADCAGEMIRQVDANIWALVQPLPPPADATAAPGDAGAAVGAQAAASEDVDPTPGNRPNTWTFAPSVRVHPDESGQHIWADLDIALDGTLGLAWMDEHASGGYHIFYSLSTDHGASWSVPEKVDDRTTGAYSRFVSLDFTPSGTAVVVWEDNRTGLFNVYFSRRDPALPSHWTPNVRVNTTGSPSSASDYMNGSLAILDENRYFVAWADWREGVFYQVYMRATRDGGVTWGTETRVSDGLGYQPVAGSPCLIVDPTSGPNPGEEVLYCVTNDWRGNVPGGRYPNVYFYRSTTGGASWSIGVRVNDVEPYYQQASSRALVRIDDGRLVCGWLNDPDLMMHHFHVNSSSDGGASWGASQRVDEASTGGTGTYSNLAARGGSVFAAFILYMNDWDVYFRASADGAASWVDPMVRVDDDGTGAPAGTPVVAAQALNEVCVAWEDGRAPGTNWKIFAAVGTSDAAGVDESGVRAGVLRAYPNPSGMAGAIVLEFSGGGEQSPGSIGPIGIYDSAGRRVRLLRAPGAVAPWDGRDEAGRLLPAGLYWLRPESRTGLEPVRVVRLR